MSQNKSEDLIAKWATVLDMTKMTKEERDAHNKAHPFIYIEPQEKILIDPQEKPPHQ